MSETLDTLGAKLDRVLALLTPVPGPDTVSPGRWRVTTTQDEDRLAPDMTPIGRFGVWPTATLCVFAPHNVKPESVLWLDATRKPLAVGDLPVSLLSLDERQSAKVFVQAQHSAANPPSVDAEVVVYVGRQAAPVAEPQRVETEPLYERWKPLFDWPSSWPAVSDEGRMPQLPEATDVETLRLYARYGYERDGTPVRGPVSRGFAGQEVEAISEMGDAAYALSRYGKLTRDLACYGVLTKRIKTSFDVGAGADLQNEPMIGVAYPSLQALLDREVGMFGSGDNVGPGGKP